MSPDTQRAKERQRDRKSEIQRDTTSTPAGSFPPPQPALPSSELTVLTDSTVINHNTINPHTFTTDTEILRYSKYAILVNSIY